MQKDIKRPLIKATMIALCFGASACSTLPAETLPDQPQPEPQHSCTEKSAKGAFAGSATHTVLEAIGKKLNVTGLGEAAGRQVESRVNCPKQP